MTAASAAFILGAYLAGSIPTGYWLGRAWKGVDVRQHGSGNLGATNVFRVLGAVPGLITLVIDILKGLIPVLIVKHLFPDELWLAIAVGIAAIVGHTASLFVRFRGGKGVATSAGVFTALMPLPTLIAIIVFAVVFGFTRFVSLGSILAVLTLVASSFILSAPSALAWTSVLVALFVIWMHRSNIQRLAQGTEHRITWGKKHDEKTN